MEMLQAERGAKREKADRKQTSTVGCLHSCVESKKGRLVKTDAVEWGLQGTGAGV